MISTVLYSYKDSISKIQDWVFGNNWPAVYIIYNKTKAYIGETIDAARRTEEHYKEEHFKEFDYIYLISGNTFNKSVVLDLEAFLIKYMSADATRKLINGNDGIDNHNYFYKEVYEDDFKIIWSKLIEDGIVTKTLSDIENSSLFKYSPYKTLNVEQKNAVYSILDNLCAMNHISGKTLIKISGGAGTGKTILAVFLIKLIVDLNNKKKSWIITDDNEESLKMKKIANRLTGIHSIGFVVPMSTLRKTMKTIFDSIDGLDGSMILSPDEVTKNKYDLLVVDEAHRLYKRHSLPSGNINLTNLFDSINKEYMKESFKGDESDLTELDWIIKQSSFQILFYDNKQRIRMCDIDKNRFESIINPILYSKYELYSQMRCKCGNGYYEYLQKILEESNINEHDYKRINNYEIKVVDSIDELLKLIQTKKKKADLCMILTGPGWKSNDEIVIDNHVFHWSDNQNSSSSDDAISSIHRIQGFDLNYAGVIFGREIYYSEDNKRIEVNRREVQDKRVKPKNDDKALFEYVMNIYLTLLTRGIDGTYIYAIDDKLRYYLKGLLNQE